MNRARKGKADPGCPYCSGRKVLAGYNDLATTHPGIAAMWHPRMNKRLKPTGVQAVSRKPAWWRGECGHVYQMAVRDRVRAKPGYCPYCSGRKRPDRPIRLDSLRPLGEEGMGEAGWRLLPIGVILRILDRTAMRGGYEGPHRFQWLRGLRAHGGVEMMSG